MYLIEFDAMLLIHTHTLSLSHTLSLTPSQLNLRIKYRLLALEHLPRQLSDGERTEASIERRAIKLLTHQRHVRNDVARYKTDGGKLSLRRQRELTDKEIRRITRMEKKYVSVNVCVCAIE